MNFLCYLWAAPYVRCRKIRFGAILLCAMLCFDSTIYAAELESTRAGDGSFTVIDLSSSYDKPDILASQTKWIRENKEALNVVLVLHSGDVTKNNTAEEWGRAKESLGRLAGVVPYLVAAGNHESFVNEGKHVGTRDAAMLNRYLPVARFSEQPWYGGCLDGRDDNMFFVLNLENVKYLIISIEFAPRIEALNWANQVVSGHPDCRTIVLTHSFIRSSDTRHNFQFDPQKYNQANLDREEMWERFVSQHRNIFLVLSSHYFGVRRETSLGDHGNPVHQVKSCYLEDEHRLQGYLRIVRFAPKQGKIQFRTYSPLSNQYLTDKGNQFELPYPTNAL